MVNAIDDSCSRGCAEAWLCVGSIDLKLQVCQSLYRSDQSGNLLLAQVVSEVCDSVLVVANKLLLRLLSVVLFTVDV